MKRTLLVLALLWTVLPGIGFADDEPRPADDPIARALFPPDLVMRYGAEIGLDVRQKTAMREAIQKMQAKATDSQWELAEESGKLARLLDASPVDEAAVLAVLDRVLAQEREVKRAQIALLVQIKNLLTPAQQGKLRELRGRAS